MPSENPPPTAGATPSSTSASPTPTAAPARRGRSASPARARARAIRPQAAYAALQEARARQHTAQFREHYAQRAGIAGTIAQGVGLGALRRSRYRGLAKTRLLHFLIAAAHNLLRLAARLAERPLAQTRTSAFARLAPATG